VEDTSLPLATGITYNAAAMLYGRIVVDSAGEVVTVSTSPDKTTWTTRRTGDPAWSFAGAAAQVQVGARITSGTGSVTAAAFDEVGTVSFIPPPPPPATSVATLKLPTGLTQGDVIVAQLAAAVPAANISNLDSLPFQDITATESGGPSGAGIVTDTVRLWVFAKRYEPGVDTADWTVNLDASTTWSSNTFRISGADSLAGDLGIAAVAAMSKNTAATSFVTDPIDSPGDGSRLYILGGAVSGTGDFGAAPSGMTKLYPPGATAGTVDVAAYAQTLTGSAVTKTVTHGASVKAAAVALFMRPGASMSVGGLPAIDTRGNLGATPTLDMAGKPAEVQLYGTLNANAVLTVSNISAGQTVSLALQQDATGGRTFAVALTGGSVWAFGASSSGAPGAAVQLTTIPTAPAGPFSTEFRASSATVLRQRSPVLGLVTAAAPANTAPPTVSGAVSGTAATGTLLTAVAGSWTGSPTTFAYQWQRNTAGTWADIPGATTTQYTLVTVDEGNSVRVRERATSASSLSTDAFSGAVSVSAGFTFYVDSAAAGGGNGSLQTPWNSLTQVNNAALTPGQSVGFKRGQTWTGSFSITESGTSSARIRLGAYGSGARPIIDRNNTSGHTIAVTGGYITVEDLDIRNAGVSNDGGEWANVSFLGASAIGGIVQRCRLAGGQIGVRFQNGATFGLVTGCDLDSNNKMTVNDAAADTDYGAHGIFIGVGCNNTEVNYCTSTGHVATSIDYGFDGSFCEIFGASNCLIHHNVSRNDLTFVEMGTNNGNLANDNKVYRNLIASAATVGGGAPLAVMTRGLGDPFGPCYRTIIEHNTIHVLGAGSQGVVVGGGTVGTDFIARIRNNIIVSPNTAIAVNNTGNMQASYNVYSGTHQGTIGTGSTNTATPGWVAAGTNGLGDYHLTSGAVARDTALGGLGYNDDIEGNPISGTPDRGAYEYQP
jgi:hypothetical protein